MDKKLALETLKSFVENTDNVIAKDAILALHPELAESEDERIRKSIIRLLQVGGYMPLEDKEKAFAYLEKQKPSECLKPERDCWYVCIKDFYGGGKKQCSKDDLVQAKGGMYMMGREDISEWFRKAYYDEIKPAEWSEEDKKMLDECVMALPNWRDATSNYGYEIASCQRLIDWLKSLPERFNLQPKQENEPMKIKYAGKIYKVYGTEEFPGGIVGYKINDEPGQFDYIINPDEVLGGGYDIKSKETPYPTKEANLDQHHWKPSEEQMKVFLKATPVNLMPEELSVYVSLCNDIQKLM